MADTSVTPVLTSVSPVSGGLAVPDRRQLVLSAAKPLASAPLPVDPVLIAAGVNVAARSVWRRLWGWKKYPGSVEAICRAVVEDCWTGRFFAGSAGHFKQFWTRDLAMCTPALVRLGYRDRVVKSWEWGLERFEKAGKITTTIFFQRFPRDVYSYACDSLPLLLYALREAGAGHLIRRHRDLLAREVHRFYATVFDPELGLARSDGYFSAPRDCMTGRSTVFANTMVAALSAMLEDEPSLPRPPKGANTARQILAQHWTGDYFRDALDRDLPSGDGNVWPFFLKIFGAGSEHMMKSAFKTLEDRGLTSPIPLRYFEKRLKESELPIPRLFTPNYQGDTSWTQLGPIYVSMLRGLDDAKFDEHRNNMSAFIERDRNYLELYLPDGNAYAGRAGIYYCDEGMIWASLFLDLL